MIAKTSALQLISCVLAPNSRDSNRPFGSRNLTPVDARTPRLFAALFQKNLA